MANIACIAMHHGTPSELGLTVTVKPWPGGGVTSLVCFHFGNDVIELWPADPERLRELSSKLLKAATEVERLERERLEQLKNPIK